MSQEISIHVKHCQNNKESQTKPEEDDDEKKKNKSIFNLHFLKLYYTLIMGHENVDNIYLS